MSTVEFFNKINLVTGPLNSFAYNLTKSSEDAQDLFQETAFRALTNKEKFRPGTNFKAVSYTHLRAHETRHDLVCRLLLEKKK